MKFIRVHPRRSRPFRFFCEPPESTTIHCGREFLPPVSVDSMRPWRVEIDPVDVELRGPWEPQAPGTHYSGPWARLYYRELTILPTHTRRRAERGADRSPFAPSVNLSVPDSVPEPDPGRSEFKPVGWTQPDIV